MFGYLDSVDWPLNASHGFVCINILVNVNLVGPGPTVEMSELLMFSYCSDVSCVILKFVWRFCSKNKNLCGRDGRTICGPLREPKSTYVTLVHKRKPKFFYFGCSLVRRCNCKQSTSANGTDGQTDRQTDRQTDGQSATQYTAPAPLLGRRAA